jgi:polyvinyl alcohol dehydrogenase (cytochrome)
MSRTALWCGRRSRRSAQANRTDQDRHADLRSVGCRRVVDANRRYKRGMLYITTGDNYSHPATELSDAFVALDLKTAKWRGRRRLSRRMFTIRPAGKRPPTVPPTTARITITALLPCSCIRWPVATCWWRADPGRLLTRPGRQRQVLQQQRVGKGGTNGGVRWGTASDGRYVSCGNLRPRADRRRYA